MKTIKKDKKNNNVCVLCKFTFEDLVNKIDTLVGFLETETPLGKQMREDIIQEWKEYKADSIKEDKEQ